MSNSRARFSRNVIIYSALLPLSQYSSRHACLKSRRVLCATLLTLLAYGAYSATYRPARAQDAFPAPPADRSQIYVDNGGGTPDPLPFEAGTTPLKTDRVAGNDKRSYIELKGTAADKTINESLPRFYLFVSDEANVHPPFIVQLSEKNGARRVTAMAQKGMKGFAIDSAEIVKPRYRVLSKSDGALYMEIRPRESLAPGEYAIIGTNLDRIATFRIATASNR